MPVGSVGSEAERLDMSIYRALHPEKRTICGGAQLAARNSDETLQPAGAVGVPNDFDSIVKLAIQDEVAANGP